MKKVSLPLFILFFLFIQKSFSQSDRVAGPAEMKLTDSLCASLNKLDLSKIGNGKEAQSAFMDCFMKQSALFEDVAAERHVAMDDNAAMHKIGVDIGKNLMKEKCDAFLKLAVKMAEKTTESDESSTGTTTGSFKRIDLKGFNYLVIDTENNTEKSFIWLRQFPGSEKFMNSNTAPTGTKLKITWQEIEVYLPQAKGYYKVKEITGIDIL
ncbi:MAG: hypothetical protein ACHQIM_04645 [Sphingobacteriales bacterium]